MNLNLLLTSSAASTTGDTGWAGMLMSLAPLLLIVVVFYFMLIRPQKKKEKEVQKMRSDIQVGDEIVTIGGIIGRVVSMREDTLVIETGSDRSKVRISRWAIQSNNTTHDDTTSSEPSK